MNPPSSLRLRFSDTRLLLSAICLCLAALRVDAASYYVDYAAGANTNSGTSAALPWKHCPGDAAATGTPAAVALVAGDTVNFKGGVTYVFTGPTGIALRWSGAASQPITYDGNSTGAWGAGRARFSDNHGGNAVTAFTAATPVRDLVFKSLEIAAIGGSAALPADTGAPATPRFGGGFAFNQGATSVLIEGCAFFDLGYSFNQKPMSADSLNGVAISASSAQVLKIRNCEFARVAVAIDLSRAAGSSGVEIGNCSFRDSVVWTIDLPASSSGFSVYGCTESNNVQFNSGSWLGYGHSPRTAVHSVSAGANLTLRASAVASPAPSFQWRKNGAPIAAATGSTFTLNAISAADAGSYSVLATNSAGSTVSNDALVEVNSLPVVDVAPAIVTQPANLSVGSSSTATFTVVATGVPAPTFAWMKNGTPIAGATSATLSLANVTLADAGGYSVVVSNRAGSVTSSLATLSITTSTQAAPVITTHPANVSAPAFGTATFVAAASGSPTPTYQWMKNGVAINGWTSATLRLEGVSANDIAAYSVVATNSAGSATSNSAWLSIGDATPPPPSTPPPPTAVAPAFTTQPESVTAPTLSTVTFAAAASGTPTPTYQWKRNGVAIAGWTNATLTLEGVSSNDAGTYTVEATNSAGSATSNPATLSIGSSTPTPPPTTPPATVAPVFTTQPVSVTAPAFSTVTFAAVASGTPTPTYQWKRNGVAIAGWTNATLTLEGVSSNDAGTYTVEATNSAGAATSNPATLSIGSTTTPPPPPTAPSTSAPVITLHPVNVTVNSFSTATFTANATGTPAPTFQWLRNGVAIAGWTNATLALEGVSTNDIGSYALVATNSAGTATSNAATLNVVVAPPSDVAPVITQHPIAVTIARLGTATFTASASGTPAPTFQWLKNGAPIAGWTNSTLKLEGVSSNDIASYSVVATNSAGSATSNPALLTLLKKNVAAAPAIADSADAGTLETQAAASAPQSRLVNLSVRSEAGAGSESLIVGFVISGDASKSFLVRGIGPTLGEFGVPATLADPALSLYSGATMVGANDNWSAATEAREIAALASEVGAFELPASSRDAVLLQTLGAGVYTAQVSGADAASGSALVELYDATRASSTRLVNLSVRTVVGAGAKRPIIGFVVEGAVSKKLLVRAIGPGLSGFGVSGVLADPELQVYRGTTAQDGNDNWGGAAEMAELFTRVGAFPLSDAASKDAALVFTAEPGAHTVVVSGVNDTTGVVIVEVYEVQ